MNKTETLKKILSHEENLSRWKSSLKDAHDEKEREVLESDIKAYEYFLKCIKMDMTPEERDAFDAFVEKKGVKLKYYPKTKFTKAEKESRDAMLKFLNEPLDKDIAKAFEKEGQ